MRRPCRRPVATPIGRKAPAGQESGLVRQRRSGAQAKAGCGPRAVVRAAGRIAGQRRTASRRSRNGADRVRRRYPRLVDPSLQRPPGQRFAGRPVQPRLRAAVAAGHRHAPVRPAPGGKLVGARLRSRAARPGNALQGPGASSRLSFRSAQFAKQGGRARWPARRNAGATYVVFNLSPDGHPPQPR